MRIEKIENPIAVALYLATALAVYIRLHYGVSVGDEAHYTAAAYMPMIGGKWFVNEKTIQQTSGILFSPFVLGYAYLFGTDGILLFVRHLHLLLSLAVSYQVFRLLQHFNRTSVALLLSALVVAFVPHDIPSLSYNTMGSLFFGLATALGCRAWIERRKWPAALSGVSWVMCGYVYPFFISAFLVFVVAAIATCRQHERRRDFLLPLAAGCFVATAVLGGHLVYLGVENVLSAVEYSRLFNSPGSIWKLVYAFKMLWVYMPPVWLVVVLTAIWFFTGRKHPEFATAVFVVFLLSYFIFGGTYESMPVQVLLPVLPLFSFGLAFHRRCKFSPQERCVLLLIVLPALVGSVAACLSSRLTLYVMCLTGVFGALATVSLIMGARRWAGWIVAVVLVSCTVYEYYGLIYEDDLFSMLDRAVESGPFKGLITFTEKALYLENLQSDLKTYHIENKTILFKDLFPGGYLMAHNIPAGPTLYIAPPNFYPEARPVYARLFQDTSNWPEVVVELIYYPIRHAEKWWYAPSGANPYNDPFKDFFQRTSAYEVLVERPSHRILVRRH